MLSFLLALSFSRQAAADCLDGAYDFGPQAAVLRFECVNGAAPGVGAIIQFCSRAVYLKDGSCTGSGSSVPCTWGTRAWTCSESANNFTALITRVSDSTIDYKFSSDFNDGELIGRRILR